MATYTKGKEEFEVHIYRPGRATDWFHAYHYENRGDQLIAAAKSMDEGYDFDGKGNKVQPHHVELVIREKLTK